MLVLSRKRNECVDIGGGIVVMVVEIMGDKVRLGFKAPKDVLIHRREVTLLIERQKQEPQEQGGEPS